MTMKKNLLLVLVLSTVVSTSPLLEAGQSREGKNRRTDQSVIAVETTQALNDEETAVLIFTREEEKLARDVYLTLHEIWDRPVFANIARAEQKHMDSVAKMLNRFAIDDPVVDDSISAFTNDQLAAMYDTLANQGERSLLDALNAGALIEEMDILDLQGFIEGSNQPELISLYEALLRGSRNHLRAFVRQIENLGVVYEAQTMNQHEVDEIVDSPVERGSKKEQAEKGSRRR